MSFKIWSQIHAEYTCKTPKKWVTWSYKLIWNINYKLVKRRIGCLMEMAIPKFNLNHYTEEIKQKLCQRKTCLLLCSLTLFYYYFYLFFLVTENLRNMDVLCKLSNKKSTRAKFQNLASYATHHLNTTWEFLN